MRRLLALLATAFVIGAVTVPTEVAAEADPVSSCTTSRGVLVVVDFRHFGGSVTRGCDVTITTGWNALQEAGFSVKGTQRYPSSFVCRINNRPTPQQDPCVNTPPTNAYWSYWHADAGRSTWSYSTQGAQNYQPRPGSIDAWVFGGTDVSGSQGGPTFTPAQARSGATSGGGGSGGGGGTGGGGGGKPSPARHHARGHASGAGAPGAANRPAAGSTRPRRVPSGTTTPGATTSRSAAAGSSATGSTVHPLTAGGRTPAGSSGPQIVDATAAPAAQKSAGGSALPVILGLALALLLGGGAGWTVLRRRRAEAADH